MKKREHTISGLVRNGSGVLFRVAEVFAKEKINIKSLSVGETENEKIARMTIVVYDEERKIKLAEEKINNIKEVIAVDDLTIEDIIDRELALIKVSSKKDNVPQIMQIVEIYKASVVGVGNTTITIEITGEKGKIAGLIKLLTPFGIKSVARTGKIAVRRGDEI
ncbi:MAG: acetolactate synthase small subunit [Candidatus Firestonebacteria bacterium RIFOXYC2_FULL_39_67]|nr:MAG: acetolactate synthase small subunit [Candidatus Firestonebacteria bacterium RIFOXYD2_FULL_39_29]OGF54558.1 MAG: acetolactate synthase small subunit [Candidatus Firestonebacteria bacterium RIFOXYC2_FULL_39_67]OGF56487.1 MAG: acetolactate synthase small subunit [Candidatus Firestonebacteria bacterium RifOxyC12_full_39_7]